MAEPGRQEKRIHPKLGERTWLGVGGGWREETMRGGGVAVPPGPKCALHNRVTIRDLKCHPGRGALGLRNLESRKLF